jgi:hypothetical protein
MYKVLKEIFHKSAERKVQNVEENSVQLLVTFDTLLKHKPYEFYFVTHHREPVL